MNRFTYTIVTALCLFAAASCDRERYLDIQPKGVLIPSRLKDFRLLLDNPNSGAGRGAVTAGLRNRHSVSALLGDNVFFDLDIARALGTSQENLRAYLFEDAIYSPTQDDVDWNNYYEQIYVSNVILEGLGQVPDDSPERRRLEAEARLHRAYAYFNLVNLYATHYNAASAGTDLGVPIRTGIGLTGLDFTRASVQEVYELVLADIRFGTEHLDDTQPLTLQFRPSKAAAYGLLARVYLYQANYAEALTAIQQALALQSTLRDINNDPISAFAQGLRVYPAQITDPEIVWFKERNFLLSTSPSAELMALYEDGDVRREWYTPIRDHRFFGQDVDGLLYGARFSVSNPSEGINTPELYLIRAECHARLGNVAAANDDLNALRIKRFTPAAYAPVAIADQAELLRFVKDERRRELASTNADRLFDIKRYNLSDQDAISIARTYDGQTVTVAPGSRNWVMPIGEKYIQLNGEIEQNARD